MTGDGHFHLVRLRPRADMLYVSQNRTVLATDREGFITGGPFHGLLVYQTRLLSRYRYLINGKPPQPVSLSNVEQHSWLGYYITKPPGGGGGGAQGPGGAAGQHAIEMRLSRFVGDGFHEDVDLTNFTQKPVELTLELEVDADFADQSETKQKRKQQGEISRQWQQVDEDVWELAFDYLESGSLCGYGDCGQGPGTAGRRSPVGR